MLELSESEQFISTSATIGVILLLVMLGLEYSPAELTASLRSQAPIGLLDGLLNAIPGAAVALVAGCGASAAPVPTVKQLRQFRILFPEGFTRAQMAARVNAVAEIAELGPDVVVAKGDLTHRVGGDRRRIGIALKGWTREPGMTLPCLIRSSSA